MSWIEWSPEYNVHIDKIDEQHKKLVGIINKLYESLADDARAKEFIGKVIEDLLDYTRYHFGAEEDLMKNSGHPNFLKHKAEHDSFVKKVLEFNESYEKGLILVLRSDIIRFLRDWLLHHILTVDKNDFSPKNRYGWTAKEVLPGEK